MNLFLLFFSILYFLADLDAFEFNGSYKISPKPCKSDDGGEGICMFVWECLKSDGRHLGMCVDGFMFGSCCGHDSESNKIQDNGGGIALESFTTDSFDGGGIPSLLEAAVSSSSSSSSSLEDDKKKNSSSSSIGLVESNINPILSAQYGVLEDESPVEFITKLSSTTTSSSTTSTTTTTTERPTTTTTTTTSTTTRSTTTTPKPISSSTYSYQTIINPSQVTTESPDLFQNYTNYGDYQGCGIAPLTTAKKTQRIVGGSEANYGQFPWQVSVRRTSFFGFSSTHRCGGALVSDQWVATAGHCVDDLMTSQIRIRLGEWDFSGSVEDHPHTERGVSKKIVHPNYNFFTYENDLALLKLSQPIPLAQTPHIVPICLPGSDDLLIGENATVTGWGRLSEGGQLPNRLQHVTVPIISNEKCRDMFLKSGRMEFIPDIFLCAGYETGGRDSCQGDSGGPLQVKGLNNRYFLAGIISWGIGCAEPNMPGVCTRISKFRDFILSQTRGG